MAGGFRTPLVGVLVGLTADEWENREENRKGVSYRAYVSQSFDVPPVEVTISAAEHGACLAAGQWAHVEGLVEMRAFARTGGGAQLSAKAVRLDVEPRSTAA